MTVTLLWFPVDAPTMPRQPKLVGLIEKYDLEDLGEDLERMWVVDETHSLRELAEEVNVRIVRTVLRRAGVDLLDGEARNYYRLLREEDPDSSIRVDAVRRLERNGVDVAELETDFVTYQSVRTFLNSERNISYERDDPAPEARRRQALDRLRTVQGRYQSVAKSTLSELENNQSLDIGAHEVSVSATVFCKDCGRPFDIDELLTQGSCNCS